MRVLGMNLNEQLHNSKTHAEGYDPSCPVCAQRPTATPSQNQVVDKLELRLRDLRMDRDIEIRALEARLQERFREDFAAGMERIEDRFRTPLKVAEATLTRALKALPKGDGVPF
jgi:hypothetical protein